MQLRKIVTGMLIASSLTLSAPVLAAPAPDAGMLEGDGGGFAGGAGIGTFAWIISIGALALSIAAIVDASKSP